MKIIPQNSIGFLSVTSFFIPSIMSLTSIFYLPRVLNIVSRSYSFLSLSSLSSISRYTTPINSNRRGKYTYTSFHFSTPLSVVLSPHSTYVKSSSTSLSLNTLRAAADSLSPLSPNPLSTSTSRSMSTSTNTSAVVLPGHVYFVATPLGGWVGKMFIMLFVM